MERCGNIGRQRALRARRRQDSGTGRPGNVAGRWHGGRM